MIILSILGILAAIALPAYEDYKENAVISTEPQTLVPSSPTFSE